MSVPVVLTQNTSLVVIGLGNPQYGDSGIGDYVANEVATWSLPGMLSHNVQHLTPELCPVLASADLAIFVTSSRINRLHGVTIKQISVPTLNCLETTTRKLKIASDPRHLIALTNAKFGQYPQTFLIKVPADDFFLENCLSPMAKQGVDVALTKIESMIEIQGLPNTAC